MSRGNIDNFKGKRRIAAIPTCHPEKRHYAKGLCIRCYSKEFRNYKQIRKKGTCLRCGRFIDIVAKGYCQTCFIVARREDAKIKLLTEQGMKCANNKCHTDTSSYELKNWCLDHDNKCCTSNLSCCGECIRGVLCRQCNTLLGMANDDVNVLIGAVEYLNERKRD